MARSIRIEFPGAFYHVLSRGNERRRIYRDPKDYHRFIAAIGEASERYGFRVHAYALMPNHYHLLVETPRGKLSLGMQHINGTYCQYFNRRHRRAGHLFQGRFKALLVERESYLLTLSRYIHQNPTKSALCPRPWDYPWSSCRQFLGLHRPYPWMVIDETLGRLASDPTNQRQSYREFIMSGPRGEPLSEAVGGLLLGSSEFVARNKGLAAAISKQSIEFAPRKALLHQPSAEAVLEAVRQATGEDPRGIFGQRWRFSLGRSLAIHLLRETAGLSLLEIGSMFSLTSSGVSRASTRTGLRLEADADFQALASRIRDAVERRMSNVKM